MVDSGRTTITQNLANTNADLRSHAKKVLELQKLLLKVEQQQINHHFIRWQVTSRMSVDELMTFRDRYRAEYLKEIKLARIRNKQGTGNTPKVRFTK